MSADFRSGVHGFTIVVDNPESRFSPRVQIWFTDDEGKDIIEGALRYVGTSVDPKNEEWLHSRDNTDDY